MGLRARDLTPAAQLGSTIDHESQLRYLRRAQQYLATHGRQVSLEATDVYASRFG